MSRKWSKNIIGILPFIFRWQEQPLPVNNKDLDFEVNVQSK